MVIDNGDGTYTVAINLGKMTGKGATTYHDIWPTDDYAQMGDEYQEINRSEEVNKKVSEIYKNQRIIAENAQFTGIAAGQGVGFTTGLLHLRKGLGMRETPIRPHSWHCRMQSDYQYD